MNTLARVIGVAFFSVSLISLGLLGICLNNYVLYTEARLVIPENVFVSDVQIPLIEDESEDVTVHILYNVTNPSRLPIIVTSIESYVYMDNKSDSRPLSEKLEDILVGIGSFSLPKDEGHHIGPGESKTISVDMTISGGTRFMSLLNTTHQGKYYPVIDGAMRYTFENIDIVEVVGGVMFIGSVEPYT